LPSWFDKLLEANFSYFAKIRWMSSWFAKLLELLLGCHLSQVGKPTPRAHICAQQSATHPSGLEEVEEYKNNFVFLGIPDVS
jgi:hypothetical protein